MEKKTKRVTIQIPLDLLKKIESQAKDNERDISKEIRFIVKSHVQDKQ